MAQFSGRRASISRRKAQGVPQLAVIDLTPSTDVYV
jgi:hypothetical protein